MKTQREQAIFIIRKKKKVMAGHHGGAWKVAFADFMTAMMALFLVLWLVTQSSDVRSAIAGYFQDPLGRASEFGNSILKGDGAQAARVRPMDQQEIMDNRRDRLMQLSTAIKKALPKSAEAAKLSDHVVMEVVPEGLRISLVDDSNIVFFESGSAQPLPATREILIGLGQELAKIPLPLVVDGHTDAKPFQGIGTYTNWELSADRANAARRLLLIGGVPDTRIAEVRGLADREPRLNDPFAPQNRRVTVLLRVPPQGADSILSTFSP